MLCRREFAGLSGIFSHVSHKSRRRGEERWNLELRAVTEDRVVCKRRRIVEDGVLEVVRFGWPSSARASESMPVQLASIMVKRLKDTQGRAVKTHEMRQTQKGE